MSIGNKLNDQSSRAAISVKHIRCNTHSLFAQINTRGFIT